MTKQHPFAVLSRPVPRAEFFSLALPEAGVRCAMHFKHTHTYTHTHNTHVHACIGKDDLAEAASAFGQREKKLVVEGNNEHNNNDLKNKVT